MNTYSDSKGNRYTTIQIEARIKKSALLKLQIQFDDSRYHFCTSCRRNDCKPIDISHTVSRKQAKEEGNVEILWDLDNLEILGRKCHKEKDKLNINYK